MARIATVEAQLYNIELPTLLSDSTHGAIPNFELVVVRVRDSEGAEGIGYTYTVKVGGAAIQIMIERYLAPEMIGRDASEIAKLWQHNWWLLHYAGRGGHQTSAISAIDIALWDLKAKRAQTPLWQLFGGYDPKVPVYAGGVDLDFSISQLLAQADLFQELGFRAIKMKVGRPSLAEDVARIRKMREHLGDGFPLMVDANMRWSADEAIRAARALAEFDLLWIEEPTIPDDIVGHTRIVREGGHAIAAGENIHTLYEFQQLINAGGVTFPEPDVTNCGGYTVFNKVAALAEANNLPLTSHGAHDLTVSAMAAAPNRTYMEAHGFSLNPYLLEPMIIEDGFATASARPGHGVSFDLDALQHTKF